MRVVCESYRVGIQLYPDNPNPICCTISILGAARILLFNTGEITEDGTPIWELLAEQAEERRSNGHAQRRTESPRQDGADPGFLPGLSPENGRTVRTACQPRRVRRSAEPADDGRPFHDDPLDDVLPR